MSTLEASLRVGAHHVLYDPACWDQPSPEQFDPAWWAPRGARAVDGNGRGGAWFLPAGKTEWVLRHYRRGGMARHVSPDRYLWTGITQTRAWREWRLLQRLHQQGLPVPRPVAAHVLHQGPLYRADLMTERIAGAQPLKDLLIAQSLPAESFRGIGQMLARFAAAGVGHADLNVSNILCRGEREFFLIDFDRGRDDALARSPQNMLRRLRQSLDKQAARLPVFHFSQSDWAQILRGFSP